MAAALWWGSLTTVGFLVVPMLFAYLPSPALAGGTAARLFSAQTWVTLACGMTLLLAVRREAAAPQAWAAGAGGALPLVVAGLLLALLIEFAVAPRIVARENLRLWHGVGTALYALQWLCAGAVLWKLGGRRGPLP
ncbi:DUF4149 domain-containing protein [Ramlibacter sp. AN1015]|uniref:DUF4149 domain-containing protein n=1 Tax=Ramlibacter sp. AN1015 TaxID=3133428 RepID=UPI0030BCBBE0